MEKPFDAWNRRKKGIEGSKVTAYAHVRDVWWCSMGLNIGVETDGKNANFERPVLVIKVYNKESMLVFPLTSVRKNDVFHYEIQVNGRPIWAKLTQPRVISGKRLQRKIGIVSEKEFVRLKKQWVESL